MRIRNLQANHLDHPIGIDGSKIRLTWSLEGGKKQTALEVVVSDSEGKVLEIQIVESDEMNYTLQKEIPTRSKAYVQVSVWDEENRKSDAGVLTIVTGIDKNEWQAKWINPELKTEPAGVRRASYLKKRVDLSKEMAELAKKRGAYLYATCHGIMNIYLNGKEVTDHLFMPGTQQYNKRLMVETIEVSSLLQEGENELLVTLGDGWYRGSMGMGQNKNVYGEDIALLLQLEIDRKVIAVSDESWEATQDGPIGRNDFMDGEECDARKELRKAAFHPVRVEKFGYEQLIFVDTVPVTAHEIFDAKLIVTPEGDKVLDFGQNIVGYISFDFEGKDGQELTLIHGETLDLAGNFTIANFQNEKKPVKQEVHYICRDGRNTYHPTKTYMGFRYVKVVADFEIDPKAFQAIAVYSDMRVIADFCCGVQEVNQLFSNALWSMKGNFIDVPTDCPTREKSGYSGDCQAYIHTAMYLMDCYSVYAKWIREQAAGQYGDGVVPQICPKSSKPNEREKVTPWLSVDGGIGWSDSFEIVPYRLMKRYGDMSLIEEQYEAIKKWTAYEIKRAKKTKFGNRKLLPKNCRQYMIDTGWMWGEWLEPGQTVDYFINLVKKGDPEVGTAFFYMNLCYMEQMAKILGKKEDEAYYHNLALHVSSAYRQVYTSKGKVIEPKRQCRYVRPIAHDLLSEEEKMEAASDLAALITENGNHLNTGFLSTHELSRCLSRYGQNEKAYDLLLQKESPGWLYSVTKGCTTIPESWDCYSEEGIPLSSFNHYSYGAVVGWLMDCVAGIDVTDGQITIHPYPDERLGYARASYDSPYGQIVSEWKYEGSRLVYHMEIPANCTATIAIEGKQEMAKGAGSYDFEVCLDEKS